MMHKDALTELGLAPDQTIALAGQTRTRLLNFLLRWNHLDDLHACLDALIPARPSLVSLLDLRARAFLAQDQPDAAFAAMHQRLALKTSSTARALLARIHLARAEPEAAHQIAQALVAETQDSSTAWNLLGQVELARGDVGAAQEAYRRLNELSPQSRAYLLGMIGVYQAQQDWVTASGYAVRLLRTAAEDSPLPIGYLRQLCEYFQASAEETRVADIEGELSTRYTNEMEDLRQSFVPTGRTHPTTAPRPEPLPETEPAQAETLPTFDQISVSAAEQVRITQAAGQFFGFETLLPGQLQTLACVLRGEDVLTILPTGGGKSLCYQLPAMLDKQGTTLIISPLIALMKDQVDSLPAGIRSKATTINSSLDGDELRSRLARLAAGDYSLAYVAPERLRQPSFLHTVQRAKLNRLVIDEAHCVSVWGHDFRPDYLAIAQVRQVLGSPPLLALTATAPPRVRRDILGHLGDMRVVAGDVTRPNLTFEVFYASNTDEKLRRLLSFCTATPGSGIIYVDTRARSEELAALLRRYGVVATHYHAGIANRAQVQDHFMTGRTRVIVATIAFGMGIDKPDIRFIVHFGPARSLEAYYQEAGRAGRDGLPSHCLLLYAQSDRATLTRRARRDLLSTEFLRAAYAAVKHGLNGQSCGRVVRADLERDLKTDDTRIRVAISLLEEAGLLQCGPDVPRTATVRLTPTERPKAGKTAASNAAFESFCLAARLRPGQALNLDLMSLARQTGIPPARMERQVLEWNDAGWIDYHSSGHDLLIEVLPPPQDAAERVSTLLERYDTIAAQRVDEMAAYAQTRRCRHGHINAYLGGRTIERCGACDNCVELQGSPPIDLPDERAQLLTVLHCVSNAPWSWGRRSLTRILRGNADGRGRERTLHSRAREQAEFGVLAFCSRTIVENLLDRLLQSGFLQERRLENGGIVIELGRAGQTALQDPQMLDSLLTPTAADELSPLPEHALEQETYQAPENSDDSEVDENLFQSLREWRRVQAQEEQVPPFVVFHDSHLRAIAAHCPTTLETLSKIKGVGQVKLAKYGTHVIEIVRAHLDSKQNERSREFTSIQ
jgi:ATP-dependent DNA helicase RecQ